MGQPSDLSRLLFKDEFIVLGRHTQGSETSQYLQEKKTTVIAQVAASERAVAQTRELAPWGCGTAPWDRRSAGERPGKAGDTG